MPHFDEKKFDPSKVIDTDTNNYAVILQSTIFPFEANVSVIFFIAGPPTEKFFLEVSYFESRNEYIKWLCGVWVLIKSCT